VAAIFLTQPGTAPGWAALACFGAGMALYLRVGTPTGDPVDLSQPVRGRWRVHHSPATRVPSHGLHAWGQTYAIDLVHDPADGSRPGWSVWPVFRRPSSFPGFGLPVSAPVAGEVVRARGFLRDHLSRTSPLGLLYLLAESVRELAGSLGVLGNHVVIRLDDDAHVLIAHLRRGSLRVRRGDRVGVGDVVGECGNSGNSSEPHVHIQAMDRAGAWVAAGLPIRFDGQDPPGNGQIYQGGGSAPSVGWEA
jgi:hypothetical protein